MLEEGRVDLHLACERRTELLVRVRPRRELLGTRGQLAVGWDDAELLLAGKGFLADLVPPLIELAFVLRDPVLRHVMRCMRRPRREVDEEWLVRRDRFLLPNPADGLVGEIFR